MSKLWIIIRREYLTRVRRRIFLISTFLTPLGLAVLTFLPILASRFTEDEEYKVWVLDAGQQVMPYLKSDSKLTFDPAKLPLEQLKQLVQTQRHEGVLVIPEDLDKTNLSATFYSPRPLSLSSENALKNRLTVALRNVRLLKAGVAPQKLESTVVNLSLQTVKLTQQGEKRTSSLVGLGLAYGMVLLLYIMLLVYGQIVMQGVMEEKTNRIMEVIISSVRPLELMMGKLIGIGAVGFTQVLLWLVLGAGLLLGGGLLLGLSGGGAASTTPTAEQEQLAQQLTEGLSQFNPWLIVYFIYYFLGGFLLYGSLFAALGSAVDQPSDGQQLSTALVMPLVIPMILLAPILQNPNGSLAFWMSLIPFFSPMIMMLRLSATEVPALQLVLSIVLLLGGIMLNGWIAARIYRIGVLMYGKKPSLSELARWVFVRS